LHICYLPAINRSVDFFVNDWNNHRVRTAGNRSPRVLFSPVFLNGDFSPIDDLAYANNVRLNDDVINEDLENSTNNVVVHLNEELLFPEEYAAIRERFFFEDGVMDETYNVDRFITLREFVYGLIDLR
jgi:hypothetical protein